MRPSYRPGISAKRGITMASPRCCLPSKEFFLSALAEVKQLPRNIIEVDRIVIDILSSGD